MPRTKKSEDGKIASKYSKLLGEEWMSEADSMDESDLKKVIIEASSNIEETEKTRDSDSKLNEVKEMAKELGAAYKDAVKYQKAKIKYAFMCLESKGAAVSSDKE